MSHRNIFYFQWKSYWRSFNIKRKTERRFFLLIFLLVPYFLGPSITSLINISRELQDGNPANLEKLLLGILLSWFILPLMANDSYLNLTPKHLIRFPIPTQKLFLVECFGLIIQPVSWVIIIGSFSLFVPLCFAPAPLINLVTALFFITFSFFFSIFLKNFFYDGGWIKKFFILCLITPVLYAAFFSPGQEFVYSVLFRQSFKGLSLIVVFTILSLYLAFKSFSLNLLNEKTSGKKKEKKILFKFIRIPGRIGGLLQKDFYYFLCNYNILVSICIIFLYIYYFVTAASPLVDSFFILFLFLFIPNITFALNSFGLDSAPGIDRHRLCPLQGYEILLSKNLAYLLLLVVQLMPIFVLVLLKFGTYILLLGFIEMLTIALLLLFWGNIISVYQVVSLQFHRFNLVTLQTAIPFIISIFIIHIGIFRALDTYRENLQTALGSQLVFLLACFFIYLVSLFITGKKLEKNMDNIREQLK